MKSASKSAFHHLSSALFLLLLCLLATSSAFGYTGGSGTAEDPYQIANAADLLELSATTSDYDANFILTEDINLASYTFTTAVIAPNLTLDFTGSFNGAGHKISNLTIIGNINDQNMLGLFGEIGFEGEVNNLGLEGVNLEGTCVDYGGLAARNNGKIINCYSDVNIIRKCVPSYVGGLVGLNGGSLINCYTGGQIISNIIFNNCAHYDTGVGGLAGGYYGSSSISRITNCYSTVNISNTVETGDCIEGTGGLVGQD
jgi:hypothetical protein